MDLRYRIPSGVTTDRIGQRWCLTTPQGGKVAVDQRVISLWERADGRSLDELIALTSKVGEDTYAVRASLACLSGAGLLVREGYPQDAFSPVKKSDNLVSAVIVSFNGKNWLSGLLPSIYAQSYSPIEIIVVDNGSAEPAGEWLANTYPDVHYQLIDHPISLAAAINLGISVASGNYYLVLNQDIILAPESISEMVGVAASDSDCAAVASKLLFLWAPNFINGVGNRVESSSWGTDNAIGWLDLGQFDHWREVPSTCFAATLIPRSAWSVIGQLDESFTMYYEDSEWSYRARLLGWRIRFAPTAVAYHAFGGKVPSGKDAGLTPFKLRNAAYGRLRFALKLVIDDLYINYMMNYLREDVINFLRYLVKLNIMHAGAYISAWRKLIGDIHELDALRDEIMQRKIQNADEVFHLKREFPQSKIWNGLPHLDWDDIIQDYLPMIRAEKTKPMPEFMDPNIKRRILVVSHDVVSSNLAGTGMRYLEMARAINRDPLDVTLAVPQDTDLEIPGLRIVRYMEERPASLQVLVENHDVALISGYMIQKFPFLAKTETSLVVDLYDPLVLENVHYYFNRTSFEQDALNRAAVEVTNYLAEIGDFFICGNERQRDFWMGVLAANGRVNPHTIKTDPTMRALLEIVGIGFPSREPHRQPFLKGLDPQFPQDCKIVLWGGGIWNWLDPLTLINAWPEVMTKHPDARLVFLGTRHPNPQVPHHEMVDKAIQLAEAIGEQGRTIRFIEWVSYADREALLSEADIGVTLHPITLETRYSLRTRVLDYIWARLPILVTQGDVTSEWVQENGLGKVVPEGDVKAVAFALNTLLDASKTEWHAAFDLMHKKFNWEQVVEPLLQYCLQPRHAPDRVDRDSKSILLKYPDSKIHKAQAILKEQGLGGLISRVLYHTFWLMTRHTDSTEP
jgi:GT2 family glycosyltransferase